MGLTKAEIEQAVAFEDWQEFRLSLKGIDTSKKIRKLSEWLEDPYTTSNQNDKDVQVLNYLNALARGGLIAPMIHQNRGSQLKSLLKHIEVRRER